MKIEKPKKKKTNKGSITVNTKSYELGHNIGYNKACNEWKTFHNQEIAEKDAEIKSLKADLILGTEYVDRKLNEDKIEALKKQIAELPSVEELIKICRGREAKTSHRGCSDHKYNRGAPMKLAHSIHNRIHGRKE